MTSISHDPFLAERMLDEDQRRAANQQERIEHLGRTPAVELSRADNVWLLKVSVDTQRQVVDSAFAHEPPNLGLVHHINGLNTAQLLSEEQEIHTSSLKQHADIREEIQTRRAFSASIIARLINAEDALASKQ